ncbi:hypothetical protein J7L48_09980, partial [bacterium]|nr:hypothetical protein [bacterium]
MKKIIFWTIFAMAIIYGTISYFIIAPFKAAHFNDIELKTFTLLIPENFKIIKKDTSNLVIKNQAKISFSIVEKEKFQEKKWFKNYQKIYNITNGKFFF